MIDNNADIKCGWCDRISKAKVWNENSKKECYTREMRRAYRDIFNENVFRKEVKPAYYKCPLCSMWSKGSQLRILNTDNERHLKLGGEPVIKTVSHKELI